jgi:coenzyme PQQ synthesis protein D (PqqD)
MATAYKVNNPTVISEVFDDEVVAVNLMTGSYTGMSQTALDVWQQLEAGAYSEDLVSELSAHYDAAPDTITTDVTQFLKNLLEQELIVEVTDIEANRNVPASLNGSRKPWQAPELAVYEDMQDLLQLDPIHDVDETGWPARKPEDANEG